LTLDGDEEGTLLQRVWKAVRESQTIIGFNVLGFDLPVLIRRSQYLGLQAPSINLDRYRTPHVDLMERLSFNGKLRYRGLDFYCKRFGIQVEDAHKGKDIAELIAAEDWQAVANHCLADLNKTQALAARLGFLRSAVAV
jgi:DNA polymerase III epsilon subunit-like protein